MVGAWTWELSVDEAAKAGEEQISHSPQAPGRGFGLHPEDSGKPLKSFKQGSSAVWDAF